MFQTHVWRFTPKKEDKYVLKPSLLVWSTLHGVGSVEGKKREFKLRVIGEGSRAEIEVSVNLDINIVLQLFQCLLERKCNVVFLVSV